MKQRKHICKTFSWVILLVMGGWGVVQADPPTTGLVLWLKADAGVLDPNGDPATAGHVVEQWMDQSATGNQADRVAGDPRLTTATFPNGSHPVIEFDGDDGYRLQDNVSTQLPNLTAFMVFSIEGTQTMTTIFSNYAAAGWGVGRSDSSTTPNRFKYWSGPGGYVETTDSMVVGENHLVVWTLEDSVRREVFLYNENAGQIAYGAQTASDPIIYNPSEPTNIGVLHDDWGQYHVGTIAEILYYNYVDDPLRTAVNAYLAEKYGIDVTPQDNNPDAVYLTAVTHSYCYSSGFMDTSGRWATMFPAGTWQVAVSAGPLDQMDLNSLINSDDSAAVFAELVKGNSYTFSFAIENTGTSSDNYYATNLFFDNQQWLPNNGKAGISVYSQRDDTGPDDGNPTFYANTAPETMGWPVDGTPGTGLVYKNLEKGIRVTLTDYACYDPAVYNIDVAHPQGEYPIFLPNTVPDQVGQFTLLVEPYSTNCADLTTFLDMDFNQDCYVNLEDFAQFAADWMRCNDPQNPNCEDLQ